MVFTCSGDESGISEKSIFRTVRRAFATTRPPRADEPDRFRIASSPQGVGDYEHAPVGGSTEPPKPGFGTRMLQVCAVEGLGIEEDRHGVIERHAVFRRVGLGLPRVPLEHVFSIYGMLTSRCAAGRSARVASSAPGVWARASSGTRMTETRVFRMRNSVPRFGAPTSCHFVQ